MDGPRLEIYEAEDGEYRARCIAANGEIVWPPEGHRDPHDVLRALTRSVALVQQALETNSFKVVTK